VKRNQADVAIVGAGVIGCAIACELAGRGLRVIVVERDSPGRQASWAAAGMLSPFGDATASGPFLELADESLRRYASFATALRDETGIDVEYRTNGRLHVSLGHADLELLCALAEAPGATRFDVTHMDGDAARRLEPALSMHVAAALHIGRDHRVNNRLLAQALVAGAAEAGVDLRKERTVTEIVVRDGVVTGVRLSSGEQVEAAHTVIAAGAWSGRIAGLPRELPVRPVKGQMFAVDARASGRAAPVVQHVVYARACYIVPREDGRLLVGATSEDVGFDDGPTPRGIAGLMSAAAEVIPLIEDLPLIETWAGFRPATRDDLPIIGPDPDLRGLIYATGHFRNGILLAPVTAACVAALIADEPPPVPLDAFSISRFSR
jgi:glycine oxidase